MKRCAECLVEQDEFAFHKGQTRCRACAAAYRRAYYLAHREQELARNSRYSKEHPEIVNALSAKWRRENPERMRAFRQRWHEANPGKTRSAIDSWHKRNPDKHAARLAKRRATQKKATPKWADSDAISLIYRMAAVAKITFDKRVEVDHVVPLMGKNVRGLHWERNLQLLFTSANRRKSAKWGVAW